MSDRAVALRPPPLSPLARRLLSSRLVHNGWSAWHVPICLVMVLAGVLAVRETWANLLWTGTWAEGPNRVFLVVPAAIWLAWVRRRRMSLCRPRFVWVGPPVMLGGWLLHAMGIVAGEPAVSFLGALLLAVGCVLTVVGVDVLRHFFPAFFALALLTPLPAVSRQVLATHSETLTTHLVHGAVGADTAATGAVIAAGGSGVTLSTATGGLHVMAALMVLVFAFACGAPLRRRTRLLLVLASPVFAVAFDAGRLVTALWLSERLPAGPAEFALASSGWLVLPVALVCLMGLVGLLRRARVPVTHFILAYGS